MTPISVGAVRRRYVRLASRWRLVLLIGLGLATTALLVQPNVAHVLCAVLGGYAWAKLHQAETFVRRIDRRRGARGRSC